MRFLAIDSGTVRCGLATCDPSESVVTPAGAIEVGRGPDLAERLLAQAAALQAEALLVGIPRNMDGTEGPRARAAHALADRLEAIGPLPVFRFDEALTSFEADLRLEEAGGRRGDPRRLRRTGRRDALAAAVLLERFLDHRRRP
ncbi:MAG TPA: Holliday junction resolvase RuvX [Myxococcota bacterium]|nr:Holliday junction resolvase RuvX [Myxococcota bacterium]HQK49559.1 Holliday junction resolvase RuvX [Myxococcota bacterium]